MALQTIFRLIRGKLISKRLKELKQLKEYEDENQLLDPRMLPLLDEEIEKAEFIRKTGLGRTDHHFRKYYDAKFSKLSFLDQEVISSACKINEQAQIIKKKSFIICLLGTLSFILMICLICLISLTYLPINQAILFILIAIFLGIITSRKIVLYPWILLFRFPITEKN